jgi:hypothetical protein
MHLAERDPQPPVDPVTAWRVDRLRNARFSASLAEALARDRDYDLHALLELTDRGCPPKLAARILSPLPSSTEAPR